MNNRISVYGAEWCPDCHRSKELLDSLGIEYDYYDIDQDALIKDKMLQITNGVNIIPTIILKDGKILQEPTNQDLIKALGIEKDMSSNDIIHDLIIIGAGPASLAAAVYTTRERIDTLILEKGVIGGMAAVTDLIDNYPGFADGVSGLDLADNLQKQAERFGAKIEFDEVTSIEAIDNVKVINTVSGTFKAKAVLIATGSDYKKIGVPGEKEFFARGVHYCATCDGAFYRDKKIAVIGGGNSAIQETLFLTRFASHIDLLVRSSMKASDVLIEKINELVDQDKVTVHLNTTTLSIEGADNNVDKVIVEDNVNHSKNELAVDGVFVFVGLEPNSKFLKSSAIKLDDIGFVETNHDLETNMPGVFAAGDIRSGATMQIASAVGEGATAALKIRQYLEE